ncbi:MAG: hypothetical protein WAW02_02685 [Sideroxyarcus sp.]
MKRCYSELLIILALAGCGGQVHPLAKAGNAQFIGGELVHNGGDANRLVLTAPDRNYEAGGFTIKRQTNLNELRKRYAGTNPKHWQRIMSGLDTEHTVYFFETIAKSADGQEISCRFAWKSRMNPAGVCTDRAGVEIPVDFE